MQRMPFQSYKCPACDDIVESRSIHGLVCLNKGCDYINMVPLPAPMEMRPEPRPATTMDVVLVTIGSMTGLFFLFSYVYKAYLLLFEL